MLMDDRDPEVLRQRRREVLDGRAVEDDRAAVGCRRAGGNVHQRRLAGAVLPEQGVHLAREHLERDVRERSDCVVVLGDAEHRQRRMHCGSDLRERVLTVASLITMRISVTALRAAAEDRRAQPVCWCLLLHQLGLGDADNFAER